jgi:hypothetical protein
VTPPRRFHPCCALVLAPLLVLGPLRPAQAQPSAASPTMQDDPLRGPTGLDPDALVRGEEAAYAAYMRGKRAFEANDFDRALVDFGDALRLLPDAAPYARSHGSVAMWIVRCHGARYGLRGEAAELDRELEILAAYASRLDAIATDAEDRAAKAELVEARRAEIEGEQARISGEHGDVDTQLDRSVRGEYGGVVVSTWAPRIEDLAWYRRRDDPRPRGRQNDEVDPEAQPDAAPDGPRRGTGMIAAGAVALGVGAAALGVMAAGMARARAAESFPDVQTPAARRGQIERGTTGNAMAVAGAVTGGVAVLAGAVLVGLGVKRRRADAPRVAIVPAAGRRTGSVTLTVRF